MKTLLTSLLICLSLPVLAGFPPVATTGENFIQGVAGNKVRANAVNLANSNVTGTLPFANYASPPATVVLYVDGARVDSYVSDGTIIRPYKTIQAALTAVPATVVAADSKVPYTIKIAPGTYDENLTIPNGRIITLLAQGTVVLGNNLGTNWASTDSKSITWTVNDADVHGSDTRPTLTIAAEQPSDATSTFIAYAGNFTISGNLNVTGDGLTNSLNLSGVKIWGNLAQTDTALTNLQTYRTIVAGTVTTTGGMVLERAYDSRFNGLLSVSAVNMAFNSNFAGGITVASLQSNLLPTGFFHCNIAGTFTGVASSARFDSATDYYFVTNGASLAGGATKVILNSGNLAATYLNGASTAANTVLVAKDGHVKTTRTTAPVATVNANAGTGATCSLSNASDVAGTANLTTTAVASASGAQCSIAFDKTYNVAPICTLSPSSSAASLSSVADGIYFTTSTSTMVVNFANADLIGATYNWAYHCIETQ